MSKRVSVMCWFCGNQKRRVRSTRGISPGLLDDYGMIRASWGWVTLEPFGACGAVLSMFDGVPQVCREPMLRRPDTAAVLRAALDREAMSAAMETS